MADLQDELDTIAEAVGDLDPAPAPPSRSEDTTAEAGTDALDRARAFLAGHPVAVGYSGVPWALRHLPRYDVEFGEGAGDADVPRLRQGYVGALFWSLHLPGEPTGDRAVLATFDLLDLVRTAVRAHREGLRLADDAAQITDLRNRSRVSVVIGPAGACALGDSLGVLRILRALGLRLLTLSGTSWAGGDGLTRFGEEVVREMDRLGVLPDLSGASAATVHRTLKLSKAPAVFTRSGARAVRTHPANLPDDVLAEVGRAQGLCLVPLAAEQTGPTVRDVADHLDHVRALTGPECVGLSGAYDSGAAHASDLADASCYPRLIAELLVRGWTEADLSLLTWSNVQRVLRTADFTARSAQQRRGASMAKITDLDG
ncbi:dipeptidase [Streptomyces chiangmaiensis]|uniref:Dipeptidase n=1 Tax=Streptomyces chiangmaiensis TaxID=766497 RepID=A0ABU7FHB4_9ACTN|nr:dipeptidase [Streptomyces chiangmaiensis]MED7823012.1 dipeptidase [Streptomyces chiangmaiensis]